MDDSTGSHHSNKSYDDSYCRPTAALGLTWRPKPILINMGTDKEAKDVMELLLDPTEKLAGLIDKSEFILPQDLYPLWSSEQKG